MIQEGLLKTHNSPPSLDGRLSIVSRLWFSWMTPLMALGAKRPLQDDDVFELSSRDRCSKLTESVSEWLRSNTSLLEAIFQEWKSAVIVSGFLRLLTDICQFLSPIFMSRILAGLSDTTALSSSFAPRWHLALLPVCMYMSQLIGGLCEAQYFQTGMRIGMQLRSSLMAMIFRKSLSLTVHSRHNQVSAGKMTNMMSSDTEQLQSFPEFMHVLWSAPFRIISSMILLYKFMGIAALAGASLLIAVIPLQKKLVSLMTAQVKKSQLFTDERLKTITEIMEGIQLVKCYTWEESFRSKISSVRENELREIKKYSMIRAINSFIISALPVLVAVFSFTAYSLIPSNPPLSAVQAFTALSLFGVLRFPLMQLPTVINNVSSCKVSLNRISEFLALPELQTNFISDDVISHPKNSGALVELDKCNFGWGDNKFSLISISLKIFPGDLIVVVGPTASGKSSLIQAILGQMPRLTSPDSMRVSRDLGPVAYCPQTPWIFNASVRDNILFGSIHEDRPIDLVRYSEALRSTDFEKDLEFMSNGDMTEIGERGVNLSGGQKHRLSLARSIYSTSQLVLLDDPLSALDSVVASKVYREGILGSMKGRARILVTNRLEIILANLRSRKNDVCPKFVMMNENGQIDDFGEYDELISSCGSFKKLVEKFSNVDEPTSEGRKSPLGEVEESEKRSVESRTGGGAAALIVKEDRKTGAVASSVVATYTKAMGIFYWIVLGYIFAEIFRVSSSLWLSKWSSSSSSEGSSEPISYYLYTYVGLSMIQLGFALSVQMGGAIGGIRASSKLHDRMYSRLVIAPMRFFNSTPLGRILNRFSKDVGDMDKNLSTMFGMTLSVTMSLFGTLFILSYTAYYTLIAFVPLFVAFFWCQQYYRATSREIKRMDSISRSPIYAHFQQIQDGISTVLAFQKSNFVTRQNANLIDKHIRFNFAQMSCNRWLGVRLDFYGGSIVLITALFIVWSRGNISVGLAGLALSTALQLTSSLGGIVRITAMLENSLNSVERVCEYTEIESENLIGQHAPIGWPFEGSIQYENVTAYYRPHVDVDPVLSGITFSIKGGEKIGVVGRTGAGKTSLIMTLFRILEISSGGQICIDGVNISQLSLEQLRKVLGIIPQDPIVFEGTVRDNIDPFRSYSDDKVMEALRAAHLQISLDQNIVVGGKNLSAGQKQQICLARVILRKSKILVLDEATSSLDVVTDNLVLETIRTVFRNSTVITIAHRLHTIVDSDRLIVLDKGRVAELGSPKNLMSKKGGIFASMVDETGETTKRYLINAVSEQSSSFK